MHKLTVATLAASLALSSVAFAQSSNSGSPGTGSSGGQQASLATANKIKQDLQNSGFSDVKVVAESFVIQAKTKDGDPVVMTVGPHGMTVFEALGGSTSGSSGSGSTSSKGTSSSGSNPQK